MTAETSNARGEWVLVPRELTQEMRSALARAVNASCNTDEWYAHTLAAAPQPAALGDVRGLVEALVREIERNTCMHEETYRGGAIWEICRQCGAQWADDEGGRPEFKWPECVESAREWLAAEGAQAGEVSAYDLAVLDDAAETLDRIGEGSAGLREARARIASALSRRPEALPVLSEPNRIGLYQGPDDCPQLMVNDRPVAIFPAGSWAKVCDALDSITGSVQPDPTGEARGVVDEMSPRWMAEVCSTAADAMDANGLSARSQQLRRVAAALEEARNVR